MRITSLSRRRADKLITGVEHHVASSVSRILHMVTRSLGHHALTSAGVSSTNEDSHVETPTAVNTDDLGQVYALWQVEVSEVILPYVALVIDKSIDDSRQKIENSLGHSIPQVSSVFAEQWLSDANNRLVGVGTELWEQVRQELATGLSLGEPITQLRDRVLTSIDVNANRATVIARTEVIAASNAGSLAQVKAAGLVGTKEWLATNDGRTRKSHSDADGQKVDIDGVFTVGGYSLQFPGDPMGPASEIVQCRCSLAYDVDVEQSVVVAAGVEQDYSTSGMIALIPSAADAERLCIAGGEALEQLHLTLYFLGDITGYGPDVVQQVNTVVREVSLQQSAISATGFGAAMWNPTSDEPAIVLNVGGDVLPKVHHEIGEALEEVWALKMPEQHCPWVPHVCLIYTDDFNYVEMALSRVGPITFDRIRVAFGNEYVDHPLYASGMTAAATSTEELATDTPTPSGQGEYALDPHAWEGILMVEGVTTGDGREFALSSVTWAPMWLPLRWAPADFGAHQGAVDVARIDEVWRDAQNPAILRARGVFNVNTVEGLKAFEQVRDGFLKGVSVDVDDVAESDIEYVFPEMPEEGDIADELLVTMLAAPEKTIFHAGRIRGATLVSLPAFVEAQIWLANAPKPMPTDSPMASGEGDMSALVASVNQNPPREWFQDPQLTGPTPLTITDDGRVFGHAALFGTCHIGVQDKCVQPPFEERHDYFSLGERDLGDGQTVAVGSITLGTGHASTYGLTAAQAVQHYDDTGTRVADVVVGNDGYGIWVAGAICPGTTEERVTQLRAAKLSGDWRRIGGTLRLVALLAVNVPGFPVPRLTTRVDHGKQLALVASGIVTNTVVNPAHDRDVLRKRMQMSTRDSLRRRMKKQKKCDIGGE